MGALLAENTRINEKLANAREDGTRFVFEEQYVIAPVRC
jgi:hypothetical protein